MNFSYCKGWVNLLDTLDRIFEQLTALGIEQKSLAQKIGVRPQAVTDWKNGKTRSYTKYIPQIAEVLDTTAEYLLTGQGPKHRNVPESDTLSEEDAQLLRQIHALSPAARGKLLGYLDALSE